MKDEFLATVSHELRTPLNAVLGWARMLNTGAVSYDQRQHALEAIERSAHLQAHLIEDLLDVSRIITGKVRLDVRPLELCVVVEAALDAVRPAAEARGVRLHKILDPLPAPVTGDGARLQQVVWNLLSNAIKFTNRGGRVEVTVRRVNSHVEIVVADTGAGISADFLPHVFERFRQADGTRARPHGGLGIGLAIVRHLVELHGGTVHAFSAGEGQGSTFTVQLPLTVARFIADDEPHVTIRTLTTTLPLAVSLAGVRVLAVDDDRESRELVATILRSAGADVQSATSAAEALRVLADTAFDVLVSDIGMPQQDGHSLIQAIRSDEGTGRRLPAVALTAHARVEDRLAALMAGFDVHVPKPVEPAELTTVIAALVRRTTATA
jgi:CheY-like chemotaxis protein